jgi:subtilase family serine protease
MRRVLVTRLTPGAEPYRVAAVPAPGPAGGLTPAELASAYGYSQAGGTGQTVGIVDAFNDPNIEADLGTFDTQYGLTACTEANGCLKVVSQTGSTTALPPNDTTGWSAEETLDVETVRAVCPNCHILLVETTDDTSPNLDAGVDEAVALGAKEVSNSYGSLETSETAADQAAYKHPGVVITAAAGDDGWFGWDNFNAFGTPDGVAYVPAALPTVVAVGGTALNLTQTGGRASETVWNDDGPQDFYGGNLGVTGATGGGCSTLFTAQPWQSHVAGYAATTCGTKRLVSDVAAVADPLTGFDIYDSYDYTGSGSPPGWITVGGTSLASPLVAAMWALAGGDAGAAYPSIYLYGHLGTGSLYDVTVGGNGFCDGQTAADCGVGNPNALGFGMIDCDYTDTSSPGTPSSGTAQCDATHGYDGPTGVGTPIGLSTFTPAKFGVITVPATVVAGTAATFSASKSHDPYPGATITSMVWGWGDGSAAGKGTALPHTYAKTGTYTITLALTDSYGMKSTVTATVKVAA